MIDDRRGKSAYAVFAARVEDSRGRELEEPEHEVVAEYLLPICANTVTTLLGYGRRWWARTDTPRKSVPRIVAIQVSVMAAFLDSFRWNAGTPLEIASTPVSATAPDEKPRSRMNKLSVPPNSFRPGNASCELKGIG